MKIRLSRGGEKKRREAEEVRGVEQVAQRKMVGGRVVVDEGVMGREERRESILS